MSDFRIIILANKEEVKVSSCDYDFLMQWKWHKMTGYASRSPYKDGKKMKNIRMHRIIMNAPDDMEVDHINGNRLDNRRCNLRVCTAKENSRNRKKQNGSSRFKGVCWRSRDNLWHARVALDGKKIFLGRFTLEEDAARAYNIGAKKYHGEFANVNILSVPDVEEGVGQ